MDAWMPACINREIVTVKYVYFFYFIVCRVTFLSLILFAALFIHALWEPCTRIPLSLAYTVNFVESWSAWKWLLSKPLNHNFIQLLESMSYIVALTTHPNRPEYSQPLLHKSLLLSLDHNFVGSAVTSKSAHTCGHISSIVHHIQCCTYYKSILWRNSTFWPAIHQ